MLLIDNNDNLLYRLSYGIIMLLYGIKTYSFGIMSFSFSKVQLDFFRISIPLLSSSFVSCIVFFISFRCLFEFSLTSVGCLYIYIYIYMYPLLTHSAPYTSPFLFHWSFCHCFLIHCLKCFPLLFESFIIVVDFWRRDVASLLYVSVLGFMHLGSFLFWDSSPLCPFSWGFLGDYLGLHSGASWYIFLSLNWAGCDSVIRQLDSVLIVLGATPCSSQGEVT
jgi:hypothetical protein